LNKSATAAFIKIDLELKSLYKDECSITNIKIYSNEKNNYKFSNFVELRSHFDFDGIKKNS
jgi:hypothetical protein